MTERIEQRYCIKFCQKLGDSHSETIGKIQRVFGNDAMVVTHIKQWFNRLKNGRTSVESHERPGRPQTARLSSSIRFLTLSTTAALSLSAKCGRKRSNVSFSGTLVKRDSTSKLTKTSEEHILETTKKNTKQTRKYKKN
ncbi:hypothetical protein C0J52_20209 [Blattella germanica]|nr:hypothetical protein C0J52_20209 [Blattella germanica]